MTGEGDYKPPKGHDRHLADTERAHSGAAGMKVRHGQDALGNIKRAWDNHVQRHKNDAPLDDGYDS